MEKFIKGQLRTLVKESRCYRDLICLEKDESQICKALMINGGTLFECLSINEFCNFKICFGESINVCLCPIRQYIAMQCLTEAKRKEEAIKEN
jgi:hypothetical protein